MKRLFFRALYYGFARHLPPSFYPGGNLWKAIRYVICRHLFASCGRNVNVEQGAEFHSGRNIRIGDNSGIGRNAQIHGTVSIG
jgi:maltose O-acetyltransferase